MHLAAHRKNAGLAFNRLVDLTRASKTDAVVAALLPRNDVELGRVQLRQESRPCAVKRFGRASIPCECAAPKHQAKPLDDGVVGTLGSVGATSGVHASVSIDA